MEAARSLLQTRVGMYEERVQQFNVRVGSLMSYLYHTLQRRGLQYHDTTRLSWIRLWVCGACCQSRSGWKISPSQMIRVITSTKGVVQSMLILINDLNQQWFAKETDRYRYLCKCSCCWMGSWPKINFKPLRKMPMLCSWVLRRSHALVIKLDSTLYGDCNLAIA